VSRVLDPRVIVRTTDLQPQSIDSTEQQLPRVQNMSEEASTWNLINSRNGNLVLIRPNTPRSIIADEITECAKSSTPGEEYRLVSRISETNEHRKND
jgi:hypothetical protein